MGGITMALTRNNINELISLGDKSGLKITDKDIMFVILSRTISDKDIAFEAMFNGRKKKEYYFSSTTVKFVEKHIDKYFKAEIEPLEKDDITFEENKAYMLRLKRQTEEAMEANEIAKKDGLKILSDLSVKLNDKFNVADDTHDTTVIVEQKYNDVCEYCGHEIAAKELTKEEAMKKYNLIENI